MAPKELCRLLPDVWETKKAAEHGPGRTPEGLSRYNANAGVADERVRGLLIKRRRPLETVALLESQKRLLCLRAYYAVERAIVEPHHVKLYLCPPDVVFREIRDI